MVVLPNNRNKTYGGAWSIHDVESIDAINSFNNHAIAPADFCNDYKKWISKNKSFKGWDEFKFLDFSNGTTETFDKFYQAHSNLKLRLLKGEYFYHQLQAKLIFKDRFAWIEDGDLANGDVVVISCPFSDTGNTPVGLNDILSDCDKKNIPVLIDMAYISISDINELDLSHPSIQVITSSLSKVFPVEHHRIGIRMRRKLTDDTMLAYNQNQYINKYSVNLGSHMIRSFSNDWLFKKYRDRQRQICKEINLEVSSCVIFGIDKDNRYSEYNRGGITNRLCFSKLWDGRL